MKNTLTSRQRLQHSLVPIRLSRTRYRTYTSSGVLRLWILARPTIRNGFFFASNFSAHCLSSVCTPPPKYPLVASTLTGD